MRAGKLFQFESMWLKEPKCEEIVQEAWCDGLRGFSLDVLGKCLKACQVRLDRWNRTEFGHVGRTIVDLQKCLAWLELQPSSPTIIRDLRSTRVDLNILLEKEDAMWRQRSRINWM